jgi:hypothetical protein
MHPASGGAKATTRGIADPLAEPRRLACAEGDKKSEQESAAQHERRVLDLACTNAGVAGFQEMNAM